MSFFEIAVVFIGGFVAGMTATAALILHIGSKALNKGKARVKELAEQLNNEDVSYAAIEPRMKRIKEIAQEQMDLQSASDGPQRNAMDGKYKNSLMRTLKELEEEKIAILTSIVKDGHDPSVNVLKADGTTEVTKLSVFLAGYSPEITDEPAASGAAKQVGKFTVLKGGKDDGGTPTTH